jgi:hypothetical protein
MLAAKTYVPLLKSRISEVEAYHHLSAQAKELTFPIFLLRPWPNANHLRLAIDRILSATQGHPFGLGLDDGRRAYPSKKPAQQEFDRLFDPRGGYGNFYNFVEEIDTAVPVLRPTSNANELLQQLGRAIDLDRGLVVHQQRGSLVPLTETILSLPPIPNDTVFVVDAAWSRDGLQMQSWAVPVVDRLIQSLPAAEIVVMGSSFPDSFSHIVGNREEVAHEFALFSAVRQRYQEANLTFGDWGSTRLPQSGGGGTIPPRVDIPRPASWHIFRADPDGDEDYTSIAHDAAGHACFPNVPDCWGKRQVVATDGTGQGITGPKMNTEPRRVCRRRWVVSHAAISMLSAAA